MKCGKKLTARTLKYAHAAGCPATENTPPAKSRKKEDAINLMSLNYHKLLDLERDTNNSILCLLMQLNTLYLVI